MQALRPGMLSELKLQGCCLVLVILHVSGLALGGGRVFGHRYVGSHKSPV